MELAQQLMTSQPPFKRLLEALILCSFLLMACQVPSTEREAEESPSLLVQPGLSRTTVLIEPQSGRQCLSTLNPNPFKGLRPRMTGEEISAVLGSPARQFVDAKGQRSLEWYRGAWRIVVAYEEIISWGSAWTWKILVASPQAGLYTMLNLDAFWRERVAVLTDDQSKR